MDGVDPSLISVRWFDNHFRLIVWKLACLERAYPQIYSNLVTPLQVLKRMKYRYEREIDHSQRYTQILFLCRSILSFSFSFANPQKALLTYQSKHPPSMKPSSYITIHCLTTGPFAN